VESGNAFAISEATAPLYRERLTRSLELWDSRDGKVDWEPAALAANENMFLGEFLLFDVAKPITDVSHLEIEKSTVDGRPHATGGGRTLDAICIDIMVTWLVNQDRGPFMPGGAPHATKPGGQTFPYVQPPNTSLLAISRSVDLGRARETCGALLANSTYSRGIPWSQRLWRRG
jgi:hypothetical protein